MPRLSLYKPEKGNDYKFIDRQIYEMFQVGGTDVLVHKYLGPADPGDPNQATSPTTIQDVLFLENRDRKYDSSIYQIRGIYSVQDIDFNLSQFGLFLQNDTIFLTIHINNSVETLGRKIMSGDVIELPHLKDDFALNDFKMSLKRYYVVEDVNRAAEGFSVTWYPHLYRLKCKPILDSQEFKDILDLPQDMDTYAGVWENGKHYYAGQTIKYNGVLYKILADAYAVEPPNSAFYEDLTGTGMLRDVMSTYAKEKAMNDGVLAEAEAAAPMSGYDTRNFYTLQVDSTGNVDLVTVDSTTINSGSTTTDATKTPPVKSGYQGYLVGAGIPPNGSPYGFGIRFPDNPAEGDYFLRTDYLPNRLFRFDSKRWVKFEDKVRMIKTNTDNREIQKTYYVNNTSYTGVNALFTDTFVIHDPMIFRPTDITDYIDLPNRKVMTKIDYKNTYGLEVFVNEQVMPLIEIITENGKIGFVTQYNMQVNDVVCWTVYAQKVQQRVALSKALRPTADL
jgi:hypothetical protein